MLKFELTEQQVMHIAAALGEAPFKIANPILQELQKQLDAQQKKPEEPAAFEKPVKGPKAV